MSCAGTDESGAFGVEVTGDDGGKLGCSRPWSTGWPGCAGCVGVEGCCGAGVGVTVPLGQYTQPLARRRNVSGNLASPITVFWNVDKK